MDRNKMNEIKEDQMMFGQNGKIDETLQRINKIPRPKTLDKSSYNINRKGVMCAFHEERSNVNETLKMLIDPYRQAII